MISSPSWSLASQKSTDAMNCCLLLEPVHFLLNMNIYIYMNLIIYEWFKIAQLVTFFFGDVFYWSSIYMCQWFFPPIISIAGDKPINPNGDFLGTLGFQRPSTWGGVMTGGPKKTYLFPKIVGFPPNHPLQNRVFHYFHHPFWGTTIFGNTYLKHRTSGGMTGRLGYDFGGMASFWRQTTVVFFLQNQKSW